MTPNATTVPQTTKCCLCNKAISPEAPVIEYRPTAKNGSIEKWFYCPRCWIEVEKIRRLDGETINLLRVLDLSVELEK